MKLNGCLERVICPKCGKETNKAGLAKHLPACGVKEKKDYSNGYNCPDCDFFSSFSQSYVSHRRHCLLKQSGITSSSQLTPEGRKKLGWSRG